MAHMVFDDLADLQNVAEELAAAGMNGARMAELLRSAAMVPQTLQVAMNSGMSDEQMAVAMRHTRTQQTIFFAAKSGLPDLQMARALGDAARVFNTPFHTAWKIMMCSKTWPETRTLMMQLVSKTMRELVNEVKPNALVRLKYKLYNVKFVLRELTRLAKEVTITHLKLSHAPMRFFRSKLRLMTGLSHCRNIQALNLTATFLGRGRGIEFLAKLLPLLRDLKELNVSKNFIGLPSCRLLTEGLGKCTSLEILNLNDNGIFDNQEQNELLADMTILNLQGCVKLTRLCLRRNGVRRGQASAILELVSVGTGGLLVDLNVSHSTFNRPAVGLIMYVALVCSLQQLNLCDCNVRDVGAKVIARHLGSATRLTDLVLTSNEITDQGASKLNSVLSMCVSMRCLDLCGNKMTIQRAQALLDASLNCTALTHLLMSDNGFVGTLKIPEGSSVKYICCNQKVKVPNTMNRGMKD
jgi:Leucine-rich repeat (LRR) protein